MKGDQKAETLTWNNEHAISAKPPMLHGCHIQGSTLPSDAVEGRRNAPRCVVAYLTTVVDIRHGNNGIPNGIPKDETSVELVIARALTYMQKLTRFCFQYEI